MKIENLEEYIEEEPIPLPTSAEWIEVTDRLPPPIFGVLLSLESLDGFSMMVVGILDSMEHDNDLPKWLAYLPSVSENGEWHELPPPTHWAYLPKFPDGEKPKEMK